MVTHYSILARKFHEQRSLVGYSPWGHKRVVTERTSYFIFKRWLHHDFTLQHPNIGKGKFSFVSLQGRKHLDDSWGVTCPCLNQSLARVMELQVVSSDSLLGLSVWEGNSTRSGFSY